MCIRDSPSLCPRSSAGDGASSGGLLRRNERARPHDPAQRNGAAAEKGISQATETKGCFPLSSLQAKGRDAPNAGRGVYRQGIGRLVDTVFGLYGPGREIERAGLARIEANRSRIGPRGKE